MVPISLLPAALAVAVGLSAEQSRDIDDARRLIIGTDREAASWMIADMEEPADIRARDAHEYQLRGASRQWLKVFDFPLTLSSDALQERVAMLNTLAVTSKAMGMNSRRALLMRGTREELALAEWLLHVALEPAAVSMQQFRTATDMVHVYYEGDFHNAAAVTGLKRIYVVNSPHALILRGTLNELYKAHAAMVRLRPVSLAP